MEPSSNQSTEAIEQEDIWELLIDDKTFFNTCAAMGVYFTIIGDFISVREPEKPRNLALVMTSRGDLTMTQRAWSRFIASFSPHSFDEDIFLLEFEHFGIHLNVFNVLYNSTHRDLVIMNPDALLDQGPRQESSDLPAPRAYTISYTNFLQGYALAPKITSIRNSNGHRIEFKVADQMRDIKVLPSIIDTWKE